MHYKEQLNVSHRSITLQRRPHTLLEAIQKVSPFPFRSQRLPKLGIVWEFARQKSPPLTAPDILARETRKQNSLRRRTMEYQATRSGLANKDPKGLDSMAPNLRVRSKYCD